MSNIVKSILNFLKFIISNKNKFKKFLVFLLFIFLCTAIILILLSGFRCESPIGNFEKSPLIKSKNR